MAIDVPRLRDTAQRDGKGNWNFDEIFNRELYPAIKAIRRNLSQFILGIQDEGTALPQRDTINFTGTGVTVTDDPVNSRTNVTIPLTTVSYFVEWGAGDLGNSTNDRFLHAAPVGIGAAFVGTTRENEGRGQRYMLVPGTFSTMLACLRGVQPNTISNIWTYNLRVNETDTALTDSFDIMDAGNLPEFKVTMGLSVHVDRGARVGLKSVTENASATVSCPYVAVLFTPDV